ncbi:heat shock transcription factor A1D [Wolffia australiana]
MEVSGAVGSSGTTNGSLSSNAPPPFLSKTYDMVDDPATDAIVSWGPSSNTFVVWNPPEFARDLLPKYFKHNNFSSFVRQLNTYGFRKVDPDKWEFANDGFLRGQKHLLKSISRRKPAASTGAAFLPPPPPAPSSAGPCVEVGKFGVEEEIERLKRDKNVLMQELIKLRQQQAGTDHQLQSLGQRLQGMEQRQQQMMSFLAKAIQSPGFLASLVQQPDSAAAAAHRISVGGKKRRLPNGEDPGPTDRKPSSPDGQIVKYQPLMNEAAKAMLAQILNLDSSPMLDHGTSHSSPRSAAISEIPSPPGSAESINEGFAAELDEVDSMVGESSSKLPGISDAFWEQFLAASPPLAEDAEAGWDVVVSAQGMDQLTEQMGLLSSDPANW